MRTMRKQDPRFNDSSFRSTYHWLAAEFGIQYYLAARSAVAAAFNPVCGSIAHHAIEMLFKACLANDDSGETIAKYIDIYRHNLDLLWAEFRRRNQHLNLDPEFDLIIDELNKWDEIRYPNQLVLEGGHLDIGFVEPDPPPSGGQHSRFKLYLPALERLASVLIKATGISGETTRAQAERRMTMYLAQINLLP